jgi:serine phosphatase RsbU (regulator of sigma subunit)
MNNIALLSLLLSIGSFNISLAENKHKMDSLKVELIKAREDSVRLKIYELLCNECDVANNLLYAEPLMKLLDKMILNSPNKIDKTSLIKKKINAYNYYTSYYNSKGNAYSFKIKEHFQVQLKFFKEIHDEEGIKNTFTNIADFYKNEGEIFKQLLTLKDGLDWATKNNFKNGMLRFITQICFLYAEQGDTSQAIRYHNIALKLDKEIGDTNRIGRGVFLTGVFYNKIHQNEKALEYFLKAIPLSEYKKDIVTLSDIYFQIGNIYKDGNNYNEAIKYLEKGYEIGLLTKQMRMYGAALLALGEVYNLNGNSTKALEIHKQALLLSEENNLDYGIGLSCYGLANDYLSSKQYIKAKQNSDRSLAAMKKVGIVQDICKGEKLSATIDSITNNFRDAYAHYQHYIILRDKLRSEEVQKAAAHEKFQADYEKERALDNAEQQKKDALAKKEIEQQKIVRNSFVGGFALMFVLAGVSYRNFKRKKKDNQIITQQKTEVENQKHLVEEKNREILDSIEYALRIQTAILPPQKIVKQYLENSFILYKPKDIVAGDFYWMENIGDVVLFAACDCTGHGVPGAMVSVVCHNALNRAVREFGLTQPAAILDKTAEIVLENFSKSEEEIQDGMDISICALNTKTKTLEWAGANNPLWLISNGNLIETKADKQCIGHNDNVQPFTNQKFKLESETNIYLFSDGFADQFGGQPERKLTKNRFKELLLSIQHLPIQQQATELDVFITNYKQDIEQTDDILVIGVRV